MCVYMRIKYLYQLLMIKMNNWKGQNKMDDDDGLKHMYCSVAVFACSATLLLKRQKKESIRRMVTIEHFFFHIHLLLLFLLVYQYCIVCIKAETQSVKNVLYRISRSFLHFEGYRKNEWNKSWRMPHSIALKHSQWMKEFEKNFCFNIRTKF